MGKIISKVLFVGPHPPPFSGPEISMQLFLSSDVLNKSFCISFIKTNFRKDNVNKGKLDMNMIFNFFKYFTKYLRSLLNSDIHLIYYPITTTEKGWLGRDALTILLAKLFKKRIIIHLRGSHFNLNYQNFSNIGKKITGRALKKVDGAIVQAEYLRNQFKPFLGNDKTFVLYQAINTEEFDNANLSDFSRGTILTVGHLTKAKGYNDIVEIIPEVVKDYPEAHFFFAGNIRKAERNVFFNQMTGERLTYKDPFLVENEILESNVKDHYHNLGIVTGHKKLELFQRCQVFISASYSEGFSRSLLEAMAMGKPLIYTPVGAHKEILKDGLNGICIEPGNKEQLVKAINLLLSNPDLCIKMGEYNYREARARYGIDKIANDLKSIIRAIG